MLILAGLLTVTQYILGFFFLYNPYGSIALRMIGWLVWVVSCIFGFLPMQTLRKKGNVPDGSSYVHTTTLVDSGIYAIVRHPQYTGWMLFNFSLMLITQDWISAGIGCISLVIMYSQINKADRECIQKFGDPYLRYMEKVPKINLITGTLRYIKNTQGRNST